MTTMLLALLLLGQPCAKPGVASTCPEYHVCVSNSPDNQSGVCIQGCWRNDDCDVEQRCLPNALPPGTCWRRAEHETTKLRLKHTKPIPG